MANINDYADLEIGLHRQDGGFYAVEFRFSQPNSQADVTLGLEQPTRVALDLGKLRELSYDLEAYSLQLTQSFFSEPSIRHAFLQAYAITQSLEIPLRLRLMISPDAPELHSLKWETLRDPQGGSPLATSENVLFSRYVSSLDWRPVRLRARSELRALALVANPSDLSEYKLMPIEVQQEIERARQGLGQIPVDFLPDPSSGKLATLENLTSRIRQTHYDILYLVCHGAMIKGEPWLWLENDQGLTARASGSEVVARLKELQEHPRLIVLASCESASASTGEALTALGPRLARAGIPAVLAMQEKVSMSTVAEFMPAFFKELQRDGQIDRAVAVARGTVRKRQDHWVPVLFMRLKSGRIWYVPGFGDERNEFEKWQSLAGFIREKTCTPIIGLGITEFILGSPREIASRWAEKHGFPLAVEDRDVLPRVAQYVLTQQSPAYLPVALRDAIRDEVLRRFEGDLPANLRQTSSWSNADLDKALEQLSIKYLENNPADPYRLLARMRLPLYIHTGPLDVMRRALIEAGAEPELRVCPWNKWIPREKVLYEGTPTPEKPLLYHLFGHINVPNSLVFAEDRYFDYLIGVTLNKRLIPSFVRAALNNTSLLFLGFQMEDWEFRVFFRYLMAQEGRELLKFYSHAAVQIEPEEDRIVDIKRARNYLEEYFHGENIGIYWGSSEEFLSTLWKYL